MGSVCARSDQKSFGGTARFGSKSFEDRFWIRGRYFIRRPTSTAAPLSDIAEVAASHDADGRAAEPRRALSACVPWYHGRGVPQTMGRALRAPRSAKDRRDTNGIHVGGAACASYARAVTTNDKNCRLVVRRGSSTSNMHARSHAPFLNDDGVQTTGVWSRAWTKCPHAACGKSACGANTRERVPSRFLGTVATTG